ncbi:MAG: hypothetical protein ABI366_11045 [Ginsengibacter sp.]
MAKYRKKPVVIESYNFDGTYECMKQIEVLFPKLETLSSTINKERNEVYKWKIGTLEGGHEVSKGDWIIEGIAGEFYPCKPDIFEKTYEPITNKN